MALRGHFAIVWHCYMMLCGVAFIVNLYGAESCLNSATSPTDGDDEENRDHLFIVWPADCDQYAVTPGRYPQVDLIARLPGVTQDAGTSCRRECTAWRRCGGYALVSMSDQEPFCVLLNINDQVISDHLQPHVWYHYMDNVVFASKTCPYTAPERAPGHDCFDHPGSSSHYISSTYLVTGSTPDVAGLALSDCYQLCSLYGATCVSLSYHSRVEGSHTVGKCRLYNTTVTALGGTTSPHVLQDGRHHTQTWDKVECQPNH